MKQRKARSRCVLDGFGFSLTCKEKASNPKDFCLDNSYLKMCDEEEGEFERGSNSGGIVNGAVDFNFASIFHVGGV